jgi:uncharacterized membrane protein
MSERDLAKEGLKNLEFNMGRTALALAVVMLVFACARKEVYPEAPLHGGGIRIELGMLPEGKPVFFTFYSQEKGINYFVIRMHDHVELYFDACAKCYPRKRGYACDGDRLYCRACDVRYSLDKLKDGFGSCYPIKLAGRVEGGFYLIDAGALTDGAKYFR